PKLAQLHGSHKGQDEANEKADEADNTQGLHAAFLHEEGQIDPPEAGLADHQSAAGEYDLPQEGQHGHGTLPGVEHRGSNAGEPGKPGGTTPSAFALGHCSSQRQEAADTLWETLLINDGLP